ncbi:hypothetical protein KUTeg_006183 [Tegillarca granosa]|uniref:Uncharacterized protein n=1 Tax=Tegillarca granosa TaxID=220873 RepID=A0ABQ9FFU3_TEGGR|nr:hypothetical protein KUTeg_006183 [Tegillarca granosa]
MFCFIYTGVVYWLYLYSIVLLKFLTKMDTQFQERNHVQKYLPRFRPSCHSGGLIVLYGSGFRKKLDEDNMWDLRPQEKSAAVVPELMVNWNREIEESKRKNAKLKAEKLKSNGVRNGRDYQTKQTDAAEMTPLHSDKKTDEEESSDEETQHKPSIVRAIVRTYGKATTRGIFIRLMFDVLQFSNPMLLGLLIAYIQNKENEPEWKGYVLASLFYVNAIVMYSIVYHNDFNMQILAMRLKSALVAALYRKSLVMNNKTKKSSTVGEIVNLMAVDCSRLEHINHVFVFCLSVPFRFILCVILLWNALGPSVLAGVAILALLIPVNTIVSSKQSANRRKMMDIKDKRSKLMSEILNGMKVLKFYAWEPSFEKKVQDIRNKELRVLRTLFFLDTVYVFTFGLVPYMVGVVTFSIYIFTQEDSYLDPGKAFVALSLFDNLKFPMFVLPHLITYFIQARVSLKRISNFIGAGELDPEGVKKDEDPDVALKIEKGTFSWDEKLEPALKNINVEVKKGKLVAVVGQVGAGKSSLFSAFLGEMDKLEGHVSMSGTVAYVPQQAWIQNATLRDNILFGKSFDETKYNKVLDACSLRSDLEVLSGGDMTEIGEKGINLSGGQKQRVNLARAVYNNSDVYLMDDSLSAVDSHVGKHIFENVIGENGLLRNKTRILITHGVHWLPMVDSIIVLTNGEISECGTYDQLLDHDGAFAQFLKTYLIQNKEPDENQECNELQDIKARVLHRLDSVMSVDDDIMPSPRQRLDSPISESGDSMSQPRSRTTSQCKTNTVLERLISMTSIEEPPTPQPRTHRPRFDRSISHFDDGRCDESLTYKSFELLMADADKTDEDEIVKADPIIEKEETEQGEVKLSVFMKYFRSIGLPWVVFIAMTAILVELAGAGANVLLSRWTEDPYLKNSSLVNTTGFKARNVMFFWRLCGSRIWRNCG